MLVKTNFIIIIKSISKTNFFISRVKSTAEMYKLHFFKCTKFLLKLLVYLYLVMCLKALTFKSLYVCIDNKDLKLNQNDYVLQSFITGNCRKKLWYSSKTKRLKSKDLSSDLASSTYDLPGLKQSPKCF